MSGIKDFAEDEVRNLRMKLKSRSAFLWLAAYWQPLAIGAAVLFFSAWLWHWYTQKPQAPVGVSMPAIVAPEVKGLPAVGIEVKAPLKVYAGSVKTKKKLKLPDVIVQDESKSVIASSKVEADDHDHTITTVINTATGESETLDRRDPLPLIAFTTRGDVMIAGGLNTSGDQVGMVQARQGLLRIKDVTLGLVGQVSHVNNGVGGHSDAAGMAAIWYGWGR